MARKVEIQYFSADGECRIETTRLRSKWVEMPDGAHPKTNDAFYQDDVRKRKPIMVVFEGVTPPLGGDMTEGDLETAIGEIRMLHLGFRKSPYSRMFWRQIRAALEAFIQYGMTAIVLAVIIGLFVQSFVLGG